MKHSPITMEEVSDPNGIWYCTFGCGQKHAGHYVKIKGAFEDARHHQSAERIHPGLRRSPQRNTV